MLRRRIVLRSEVARRAVELASFSPRLGVSMSLHGQIIQHRQLQIGMSPARDVAVYLPPGYDGTGRHRYPVFLLQDGQNLFTHAPGASDTWAVDATVDRLIRTGRVEPMVVVAIAHQGIHRIAEYTPSDADGQEDISGERGVGEANAGASAGVNTGEFLVKDASGGGGSRAYAAYLVEALLPWLAAHYAIDPAPAATGIGGSSLGALVSVDTVRRYPGRFSRLAALSPSVWWDDRRILRLLMESPRAEPLQRLWVSTGTAEGRDAARSAQQVRDTRALVAHLFSSGWAPATTRVVEVPGATHRESAWRDMVEAMLLTLYGDLAHAPSQRVLQAS